jgi:outer membrane protein TolC
VGKNQLAAVLICFTLFITHYNAFAQELSLDDAIKHALDYNLNLRKNRIDLAASGYTEKNIWSEIFPTISANVGISYRSPLFSGDGLGLYDNSMNYPISVGVSLGLNAGIPFAIKSIQLAHQGNILRYEDACNQLSIQVTKKYYSLIAEKNNLNLLEEVYNLAQRQYERSQVLFRNGLVGELSMMNSRMAFENANYNLSVANISYLNSMAEFLAMLGMSQDAQVTLLGEISIMRIEADSEALIKQHLYKRPDIVRSKQEIERLENTEKQLALQNRAPSISLSLDWSSSNYSPFIDNFSASARLGIPIDPWIPGTNRNQSISRANDSVQKAKLDLAIAEDSAKTQIRSLTALLHNSWNSILIARLGYEASQRSYQLTEQGFNNGIVESLALEDSRNNMASARQRLFQSELSYFNMILDLSAAINVNWDYLINTYGVSGE